MADIYLLAIHSLPEIGNSRLKILLKEFGSAEAAWHNFGKWQSLLKISQGDWQEVQEARRQTDLVQLEESFLSSDAKLVTLEEPHYPSLLAEISDSPYLLFYRGQLPGPQELCLAIVGSRRATAYGREVANYLAKGLAKGGAWVVGGLARGIDSAAHQGALAAGGKTLGVLGCGIDVVYPRENRQLFNTMAEKGCIISEYPLGAPPLARNFPARNRVISGLCQGVIVVEAATKSGTQITVNYAINQGRDVYAVPGSIFSPASKGTNFLLKKQDARLVDSPEELLAFYTSLQVGLGGEAAGEPPAAAEQSVQTSLFARAAELSPDAERVCQALVEKQHFNDLLNQLGMNPSDLATLLTVCETQGLIKRVEADYYICVK